MGCSDGYPRPPRNRRVYSTSAPITLFGDEPKNAPHLSCSMGLARGSTFGPLPSAAHASECGPSWFCRSH